MEKVSGILSNVPAIANYESLRDKPQVNGVELSGNKTAKELGLASASQVEELQKTIDGLIDGNEVAY
nr:MAG TPA_asm: hypothetical protein [Caudoviricetes sp.]